MGIVYSFFSDRTPLTQVANQTNKNNLSHQQPEKFNGSLLSVRQESQGSHEFLPVISTNSDARISGKNEFGVFELKEMHMAEALLEADAPQRDPAYQSLLKKGDNQAQAESQQQNLKPIAQARTVFATEITSKDNNQQSNEQNSIDSQQKFFTFKTKYEQHLKAIQDIQNKLEDTDCTSNKGDVLKAQLESLEQQTVKYNQFRQFVQSASFFASTIQNKFESCSDILDKHYSRQETVETTELLHMPEDHNESEGSPHGHASKPTQHYNSPRPLITQEVLHNTSGAA